MSLVSLRCSRIISLLSRILFQEGLLPSPPLPFSTAWHPCSRLNSMHRWSLKVITSRTDQSLILEARRGAAIVRSIIDPPAPRLNEKSPLWFKRIRLFLATISTTKIPLLSRRASPHSGDLLLKSPPMRDRPMASLRLSSRRRIWVSKTSKGSPGEKYQLYTRTPATSTQTNPASVSRKSPMPKSGFQTTMPALLDTWATSFSPLSMHVRHLGGALQLLAKCPVAPHLQQTFFLSGLLQPRDPWPYPRHLKQRATSTCSRMRHATHPILNLPSWSRRAASASAGRITAVFTPPKREKCLQDPSKAGLPNSKHRVTQPPLFQRSRRGP